MQAEENGVSLREAATRVFSNASGSYSSNVNLAVENSSWQDEQQLQEMYLKRKSFAFNSDRSATLFTQCETPLSSRSSEETAHSVPIHCLRCDSECRPGSIIAQRVSSHKGWHGEGKHQVLQPCFWLLSLLGRAHLALSAVASHVPHVAAPAFQDM